MSCGFLFLFTADGKTLTVQFMLPNVHGHCGLFNAWTFCVNSESFQRKTGTTFQWFNTKRGKNPVILRPTAAGWKRRDAVHASCQMGAQSIGFTDGQMRPWSCNLSGRAGLCRDLKLTQSNTQVASQPCQLCGPASPLPWVHEVLVSPPQQLLLVCTEKS